MAWITHFLTVVSFLVVGGIFTLNNFGSKWKVPPSPSPSPSLNSDFATAWGASLWVTFIGNIIMFKNLLRYQFGDQLSKMFSAYFLMISVCLQVAVSTFAYLHPWKYHLLL